MGTSNSCIYDSFGFVHCIDRRVCFCPLFVHPVLTSKIYEPSNINAYSLNGQREGHEQQ